MIQTSLHGNNGPSATTQEPTVAVILGWLDKKLSAGASQLPSMFLRSVLMREVIACARVTFTLLLAGKTDRCSTLQQLSASKTNGQ